MGLRGLSAYISRNPENFTDYKLHNTLLVIDAENYINSCYRQSNLLRQFGGEYMAFTMCVRRFLKTLRQCRITPIFIFGGCHEKEGYKLNTIIRRNEERLRDLKFFLQSAHTCLDPDTIPGVPDILPKLTKSVFVEILQVYDVFYVCCEREADVHLAELAILLDCPVLSNDSDFYIFCPPIPDKYKFVPMSSLNTRCHQAQLTCSSCQNTSTGCFYLRCSLFNPQGPALGGIPPTLLPLLAALIGNDYISGVPLPPAVETIVQNTISDGLTFNERRIKAIIQWLSGFSSDISTPLKAVLSSFPTSTLRNVTQRLIRIGSTYVIHLRGEGYRIASFLRTTLSSNSTGSPTPLPSSSIAIVPKTVEIVDMESAVAAIQVSLSHIYIPLTSFVVESGIHYCWPLTLVNNFRKSLCSTTLMDCLYVRGGSVFRVLFEDLKLIQSVYSADSLLRNLQCQLLSGLETEMNCTHKLVGLDGSKIIEHRRAGCCMSRFLVPISPINMVLDQPAAVFFTEWFKTNLGIDLRTDVNPIQLQGLIVVLICWFRNSQLARHFANSLRTHPVCLAFIASALVTCARLVPASNDPARLERQTAKLCEHYGNCANMAKQQTELSGAGFSIEITHQLNELQLVTLELWHLTTMLDSLISRNIPRNSNVSGSKTSASFLGFWPFSFLFPSGRLLYFLSKTLACMPPRSRSQMIITSWIPRLFDASNENEFRRMQAIQRQFCWLVYSTDSLFVGR